MSHVISSQPSATSPYQPTATQDGNGATDNTPRTHRIDSVQQDDCCIHTRNRRGCCYILCKCLSLCCQGIKTCTDNCCENCANCLNDCCEDKPKERNQRNYRFNNSRGTYYDNNDDWGISSLTAEQSEQVYISNQTSDPMPDSKTNELTHQDSGNKHTIHHNSGTHHSSSHHDSGTHHSSSHHDSGTHNSSSHHDSGTHHSSSHHDSGTHHSSTHHDSGFDTCNDGGGFDSGGGCDSGGGGNDD